MERVLEGDLSRFEVPDLLTFLNVGRHTGVLLLERPEQETKIFFREGAPVYASSTRDTLRLGSLLVRLGKMTERAAGERALARLGSGHRIGQVLLKEKLLTEEELASVLKVQVSEVVFDTFEWDKGLFTFYDDVPPPATAVHARDGSSEPHHGGRPQDRRAGRLAEFFPDLAMAVESVVNPERVKASVTLTPEEWQVYFLVDGRRTLADVCRLAGNPDELSTLLVLRHLALAKFVRGDSRDGGEGSAKSRRTSRRGWHPSPRGLAAAVPLPGGVQHRATRQEARRRHQGRRDAESGPVPASSSSTITVSRLVLLKDGAETSFPLTRDTYTLGRHRNNDIVVSDPKVSSFHARLDRGPEGFTFVDLKSRNGSYVNSRRSATALLTTGDEIRLGTAKLVYRVDYTSGTAGDVPFGV